MNYDEEFCQHTKDPTPSTHTCAICWQLVGRYTEDPRLVIHFFTCTART